MWPLMCDCCKSISFYTKSSLSLPDSSLYAARVTHQRNVRSLQSSARSCPGCQFIVERILKVHRSTEYTIDDTSHPITIGLPQHDRLANPDLSPAKSLASLEFECGWPSRKSPQAALMELANIYADERSAAATSGVIGGRPILDADDASNPRSWLLYCTEHHPLCTVDNHPNQGAPELPTRVLDVASANTSGDPVLYITKGACGNYVTLSHRWAGSNIIKTTSSNLEKHTRGIPFQSLNKTFQDAIIITRKLGFRYLWIDSLCIIQNSPKDWQIEAERMALIYGRSDLTLSATWAISGDSGLFYPRKKLGAVEFPFINEKGQMEGGWFLRERSLAFFEKDVLQGPLNRRGWVLQERLLSRRILHFCKDQLYWECKTSVWKEETGTLNLGLAGNNISIVRKALFQFKSHLIQHEVRKPQSPYDVWYMVVEDYTQRSLTFAHDRLPAILGIVAAFQSEDTGRNLWGLWEGDFIRGLLWSIEYDMDGLKPLPAPSWSWAAWNAPVHCRLSLDTKTFTTARVINIEDQPKTQNMLDARLRIAGPTKKVNRFKYSKGWTNWDTNCLLYDSKGVYVGAAALDSPSWFSLFSKCPKEMLVLMVYTDDPATPLPHDSFDGEMPHTYCLLLERSNDGTYQRIGYAETATNGFDDAQSQEVVVI